MHALEHQAKVATKELQSLLYYEPINPITLFQLLQRGGHPDITGDNSAFTYLHIFSYSPYPVIVELLLNKGADPNKQGDKKTQACHRAFRPPA